MAIIYVPGRLRFARGCLRSCHCRPSHEDVCGAAIVEQDSPDIVSCEVYRVLANVGPDDEGVIMQVMLQLKICLCEGYRDVRPQGSEVFAFAYMRDGSEVFFALPLRLMHWLIGFSGDGCWHS
jgi:hypothetical protein